MGESIRCGILIVSDSCAGGRRQDESGQQLNRMLSDSHTLNAVICEISTVSDDIAKIEEKFVDWVDNKHLDVILSTGGTGFAARDVTPEATKKVIDREAPGITTAMMTASLVVTPMAMLSRAVAGIRKKTLIVNLPGSAKASKECLMVIMPVLRHAVDLLRESTNAVAATHRHVQRETGALSSSHHHQPQQHSRSHEVSGHSHGCHGDGHKLASHHEGHSSHDNGHRHSSHHGDSHKHTHAHDEHTSGVSDTVVTRRPRHSPYPMISVKDAVNIVMDHAKLKDTESVAFEESHGRVLAEDVPAKDPLPPFPASIKDGYAVLAADGAGVKIVLGGCTAGDVPERTVRPGTCIRISTGAPLPPGADAVVQVEDTKLTKTTEDGREELEIEILVPPKNGQDIRATGSDIEQGEVVLSAGCVIGASEIGVLATVGVTKVTCHQLPIVGVMSSGNELLEASDELKPGMIRDSNRVMLITLLREHGFIVKDLGIALDSPASLCSKLKGALDEVDVVVTSGGVSMGERDLLKEILQTDLGATLHFARVHMKPGKPTTFATVAVRGKEKLFFGLPGNPVSAAVTCHLYVIPALRKMAGHHQPYWTTIKAKLSADVALDPRPEYHRCVLRWETGDAVPFALSTGNQISSRLTSMRGSNALLVLPALSDSQTSLSRGDVVDALVIGRV